MFYLWYLLSHDGISIFCRKLSNKSQHNIPLCFLSTLSIKGDTVLELVFIEYISADITLYFKMSIYIYIYIYL